MDGLQAEQVSTKLANLKSDNAHRVPGMTGLPSLTVQVNGSQGTARTGPDNSVPILPPPPLGYVASVALLCGVQAWNIKKKVAQINKEPFWSLVHPLG